MRGRYPPFVLSFVGCISLLFGCATPESTQPQDKKPPEQKKPKKAPKTKPREKPDSLGPDVESTVNRSIEAATSGDPRDAINALKRYTGHPEYGFLATYNLGVLYLQIGRTRKASAAFKKTLSKKPSFAPALRNLASLYLRSGRADELQTTIDKLKDKTENTNDIRAIELQLDLRNKQYRQTIRRAKSILREDETSPYAMLAMAEANLYLGRYELSKTVLSRLKSMLEEQKDPSLLLPKVYYLFGAVHMKTDNRAAAIKAFKQALEKQKSMPEAHNNLGLLYYESRNYSKALNHLRIAIQQYPQFKQAHVNLANTYKKQEKYSRAEKHLRKAIRIDRDYSTAYFNLGTLYLDGKLPNKSTMSRLNSAIELFNKYKQLVQTKESGKIEMANKYIEEAKKAIELEKQRQRLMQKSGK